MVEVKGEKDQIRDDQLDWIGFFEDNGINVEVCWVRSGQSVRMQLTGSHRTDETELIGREKYWKEVNQWEGMDCIRVRQEGKECLKMKKEVDCVEVKKEASDQERRTTARVKVVSDQSTRSEELSQLQSSQEQMKKRPRLSLSQELAKKRSQTKQKSNSPSILQFFSKKPTAFLVCYNI